MSHTRQEVKTCLDAGIKNAESGLHAFRQGSLDIAEHELLLAIEQIRYLKLESMAAASAVSGIGCE